MCPLPKWLELLKTKFEENIDYFCHSPECETQVQNGAEFRL